MDGVSEGSGITNSTGMIANSTHMNCSIAENAMDGLMNCTNATMGPGLELERGVTLALIFIASLVGNVSTIILVSRFKVHKVPDVLVIGVALTDLMATIIPVAMSAVSYFSGIQYEQDSVLCNFYATVAQFTRYASALIVTLISLERYFAVNRPFFYRKYATPFRVTMILLCCWVAAMILAIVPAVDSNTKILDHTGYCLFDFASNYAIVILVYAGVQYVVVLACFVLVIAKLIRVYYRRKQMQVQGNYNRASRARERDHEVTFTKPNLTSRISDLGKSIKRAAPVISEKFQLGVEAQFVRMLFSVVLLFYVSWTTIVILILITQANPDGQRSLETALFWGIRLTVISTAINPFIYGLLARQYRMAYIYVFRLWFSKCCGFCVDPPLKDVFAAARTVGGELHGETREETIRRRRLQSTHYASQGRQSHTGSLWSKATSGIPVLTRTTTRTNISLPTLDVIPEDDFLSTGLETSMADHSTHIPSAGELSSTVVIPHQKRDRHPSQPDLNSKVRSASMQDLTDAFFTNLEPHPPIRGTCNPLALIADLQVNGTIDRGAELGVMEGTAGLQARRIFSNPVYEIEKAKREKEAQDERQDHTFPPNMTYPEAKRPATKTESVNIPPSHISDSSPKQPLRATQTLPVGIVQKDVGDGSVSGKSFDKLDIGDSSTKALDIPERLSIISQQEEDLEAQVSVSVPTSSQTTEVSANSAVSVSARDTTVIHAQRMKAHLKSIVSTGSEQTVKELRLRFESSPPPSSPPATTSAPYTFSSAVSTTGRRLSCDNSDSGRESMVFEHELISPTAIASITS